jgi:DNA-binding CsgD family transcriptional regulator/tetratricopeptide (TPR) repeat protein
MPGRYASARFVGRDEAFSRLAAALDDAARGRARSVLIGGSAGIGVTRLLDEAVSRLATLTTPFLVLRAGAWPAGDDEPYGPVVRAMGPTLRALPAAELADRMGPAAPEILRLLPELSAQLDAAGVEPVREPMVTAPERRQARALEGFLGLLGRLGERQPVLLILEDLQRADAGTRALFSFLTRIAGQQRLAIVGTHQPDVVLRDDPWMTELATLANAAQTIDRWTLPALDRDELAALIEGIEGGRASASLLLTVVERSGGRPLVAEELLAARRELPRASLSGSFEALVMARLAARSLECRRILRLIAAAGRPISPAQVAAAAAAFEAESTRPAPRSSNLPRRGDGVMSPDLLAGRDEALEYGFAVESDGLIAMRHESIGRAVERDLLPTARARYHSALARGLEGPPSSLVRHWLIAHDPRAARKAAIDAAGVAASRNAAADELRALEMALEIPEEDSGVVRPWADRPIWDRVGLQVRASEAAFAIGQTARATAYLEVAIGALDSRTDRVRLGLLHERLAGVRRAAGDPDGAQAAARRAVDLVPAEPTPARARVLATYAQLMMLDGIFSDAQRIAREAIAVARACEPVARQYEVHATTTLGVALAYGSDPNVGIDLLREAEQGAWDINDQDGLFRARANLTTVLDLVARRGEAIDVAFTAMDDARRNGLEAVYGNFLAGNVAESLFLLGRWRETRELSRRAQGWLPVGVIYLLGTTLQQAIVEIEMNSGEEAARLLGQVVLEFDAAREPQLAAPYYLAAASFALWRGDITDASRSVDHGWSALRSSEEWVLVARMAAMVARVDAAVATEAREQRQLAPLAAARQRTSEVLKEASTIVKAGGAPASTGSRQVADAALATARGYQRRLEGDDDAAVWERVAEAWAALDAPYDVGLARWCQAEATLGSGTGRVGRADAKDPLLEAVEIGMRLEARPLLRELRALAARARIQLPDEVEAFLAEPRREPVPVPVGAGASGAETAEAPRSDLVAAMAGDHGSMTHGADTFGLSTREREVLSLVAQGRTNREIGEHLFISQKTVGVHVGNILAKLDVSGRVEAATVAIRLGLTDPH